MPGSPIEQCSPTEEYDDHDGPTEQAVGQQMAGPAMPTAASAAQDVHPVASAQPEQSGDSTQWYPPDGEEVRPVREGGGTAAPAAQRQQPPPAVREHDPGVGFGGAERGRVRAVVPPAVRVR